jgi:spore coat protein CotF
MSVPHPLRHNQQQVPSQSVQTPNVKVSSLKMFKAVTAVFQQIMTELNEAEPEEDRIMAITKIVLKLVKKNGCIYRCR